MKTRNKRPRTRQGNGGAQVTGGKHDQHESALFCATEQGQGPMVMGASLIGRAKGAAYGQEWKADRHDGLPPASVSAQEFEKALNGLLGWETRCWPWLDLVVFYVGAKVFTVQAHLGRLFEIAVPIQHTTSGERVTVYRAGDHQVRLHYKQHTYQADDGSKHAHWIGWLKLPDNPPLALQAQISQLLLHVGCTGSPLTVECGIDIFPKDYTNFTSTLAHDAGPLVDVAGRAQAQGARPALVTIQDTIERTLHLTYGGVGIRRTKGTTSYLRARDKYKRLKVYLAPKGLARAERTFIRVELTLEKQALHRCLQTGRGGLRFPLDATAIDFGTFFKLCRPKDLNRLVDAIYKREMRGREPSGHDGLMRATIQSIFKDNLLCSAHTEFRDDVHAGLSGANVGYWFEQVFPACPPRT